MQTRICLGLISMALLGTGTVHGQPSGKRLRSPSQLQVSTEIATIKDNGNPSSLRVVVKNAGNVTVWMPVIGHECSWVYVKWSGLLSGYGCGESGATSHTVEGIVKNWVQLRPGEFMTTTVALSPPTDQRNPKYCVVYVPPQVSKEDVADLLQAGYAIPTDEVQSDPQEFPIR